MDYFPDCLYACMYVYWCNWHHQEEQFYLLWSFQDFSWTFQLHLTLTHYMSQCQSWYHQQTDQYRPPPQKYHVLNKKFPNVRKFVTRIISFLHHFIFCIIFAQLLNKSNLYPALKNYWRSNLIIIVWTSHPSPVDGSSTTTLETILDNTATIV